MVEKEGLAGEGVGRRGAFEGSKGTVEAMVARRGGIVMAPGGMGSVVEGEVGGVYFR